MYVCMGLWGYKKSHEITAQTIFNISLVDEELRANPYILNYHILHMGMYILGIPPYGEWSASCYFFRT